jgi:hypothetical protein
MFSLQASWWLLQAETCSLFYLILWVLYNYLKKKYVFVIDNTAGMSHLKKTSLLLCFNDGWTPVLSTSLFNSYSSVHTGVSFCNVNFIMVQIWLKIRLARQLLVSTCHIEKKSVQQLSIDRHDLIQIYARISIVKINQNQPSVSHVKRWCSKWNPFPQLSWSL